MSESNVDRYSTWEMDAIVESISPAFRWLSGTFFSETKQFDGEFIEHDIVEGGHRIAPFVSPFQNGVPTRRLGYRTYQMKPAYIKLADTVRPTDGWTRRPGEPYGGRLSPMQRIDAIVSEQIATHFDMIAGRLELMARDALFDGQITIITDGYPSAVVSFERSVANEATVAVLWSAGGATPLADIETHAKTIQFSSRGAVVNRLVMCTEIWNKMASKQEVRDLVNRDLNLSPGTGGLEFGPSSADQGPKWRGQLAGQYDLWTYDGYYQDDTGSDVALMPTDKVLFLADQGPNAGMQGRRYHGAILDMDAGIQPREVFVKARNLWDPSGVEVLTQSAPMVGMRRPNATGTLKVL